jgi:DNA-binding transcriptional MerR regulator
MANKKRNDLTMTGAQLALGVSISFVRYCVSHGIVKPRRSPSGRMLFSAAHIEAMRAYRERPRYEVPAEA